MSKLEQLGINKSDQEIHSAFERFAAKWETKATHIGRTDRISRF